MKQFKGEISQLNIYNRAQSQHDIFAMSKNCTADILDGIRHQWEEFSSYKKNDVDVIMPTVCGKASCPPGFKGPRCDQLIGNTA